MREQTIRKYSEEHYFTKDEVSEDLGAFMIDPIWQEICSYREGFRYDLHIDKDGYYLTLNPYTHHKLMHVHQLMFRCLLKHRYDNWVLPDVFAECDARVLESLLTQLELNTSIDMERIKQKVLDRTAIIIEPKLKSFLLDEDEDIFVRMYIAWLLLGKREGNIVAALLIAEQRCNTLFNILDFNECYSLVNSLPLQYDVTYGFLAFIDGIRLKFLQSVISYDSTRYDEAKSIDFDELVEQYPMLNREQIGFFVQHHKLNHYYTIQDYMKFCHVCYETARYSLDKIVDQKWYRKQKMGKKFVYYVM